MKNVGWNYRNWGISLAIFTALFLVSCGGSHDHDHDHHGHSHGGESEKPLLIDMDWMVGAWAQQEGQMITQEFWEKEEDNKYSGKGLVTMGKDTVFVEELKVFPREEEVILKVTGFDAELNKDAVEFVLKQNKGIDITFENPDHDFPQRIRYYKNGMSVRAEISLLDGSEKQEWAFRPWAE